MRIFLKYSLTFLWIFLPEILSIHSLILQFIISTRLTAIGLLPGGVTFHLLYLLLQLLCHRRLRRQFRLSSVRSLHRPHRLRSSCLLHPSLFHHHLRLLFLNFFFEAFGPQIFQKEQTDFFGIRWVRYGFLCMYY